MNGFSNTGFDESDFDSRAYSAIKRIDDSNKSRPSGTREFQSNATMLWNHFMRGIGREGPPSGRPPGLATGGYPVDIDYSQAPPAQEIRPHDVTDVTRITPVSFFDLPVFDPPEGVYCVYGRPGSGKTVFSSALADTMLLRHPGLFQSVIIFVPGDRPEWIALKERHPIVRIHRKVTESALALIIRNQRKRYEKKQPNKIMIILDDQMGQGQGIHNGPLGDLIDMIAASNRQPELNIVFFVLAQHVSFIPPSMRLTTRMMAYTQPSDDSLDVIMGSQGIQLDKDAVKSFAQSNQFVVLDCWSNAAFATKSYHIKSAFQDEQASREALCW